MSSKNRFTTTDVQAMVRDLKSRILGQRLANIYDVNDKTYIFKFAMPGKQEKDLLLMESGIRFHCTQFAREKNDMPTPYVMKLRKFLRTKRLDDIRQLGNDRVVDFRFGSGDSINHILLELYANGNLILTDGNYEILALLRSHQFENEKEMSIQVGEIYPIIQILNPNRIKMVESNENTNSNVISMSPSEFVNWAASKEAESLSWQMKNNNTTTKKNKMKTITIRQLLLMQDCGASFYGSEIIEHCLLAANYDISAKINELTSLQEIEKVSNLINCINDIAPKLLAQLTTLDNKQKGFILYKPLILNSIANSNALESSDVKEYTEFVPLLFQQHSGMLLLEFDSFNEAVDEYFRRLEDQKLEKAAYQAEENARKKVEKVRNEHETIIRSLENQQQQMELNAMLIEYYSSDIDKVLLVLNSALQNGMSWSDIQQMVDLESRAGNPIASLISKLKLEKNIVVLKLYNIYTDIASDDDEDDEIDTLKDPKNYVLVDIDLRYSAWVNSRNMFSNKKSAQIKENKTLLAAEKAIKSVEEQASRNLESQKIKRNLQATRKVHWFEKFNWFISSEGYLVLSGRDAQQNELLVKRYLRIGDIYVHADIPGAASCIVRAKHHATANVMISPIALQEAGIMTISRSRAWQSKILVSAFWVHANQVSKSAPSGEYLTTGSFMIYGKKNYLPPLALEMGFGILFRLDDASVVRHIGDRKDKILNLEDDTISELSLQIDKYGLEEDSLFENTFEVDDAEKLETIDEDNFEDVDDVDETCVVEEATEDVEIDCLEKDISIEESTKHLKNSVSVEATVKRSDETTNVNKKPKSKILNKKKARKYADQDDEDRELAMIALGHKVDKADNEKSDKKLKKEKKSNATTKISAGELESRKEKAGINLLLNTWSDSLSKFSENIQEKFNKMISENLLKPGDISSSDFESLTTFSDETIILILDQLNQGISEKDILNKGGFLAGIIRRHAKQKVSGGVSAQKAMKDNLNAEKKQIHDILEEEGIVDEIEGENADELEKLCGFPLSEDILLYAVPTCGPYASMISYKYKVKLTPGNGKKGKSCKQAIEVFTKSKDCSAMEKNLIKGLSDSEMVAIMISDVKLSTPGLFQIKRRMKGKN